ncbi:MAG: M18 family aminopeptidase [Lachnospiraceae bacterium]|nr:M18 family aminopeptidase [Lachnospiraceae bacterium]
MKKENTKEPATKTVGRPVGRPAGKTPKVAAKQLMKYVEEAKTPYHCVLESERQLKAAGFKELLAGGTWHLKEGGRYYVIPFPTCIFAFAVGDLKKKTGRGLHVAAAHTDYPCLHIKPGAELTSGDYLKLNVEVYGGPILNTWFDRPLSIAGSVMLRSDDIYRPKRVVVDLARPVITIPNQAIHYNRDVNKGVELKKQIDLLPLFGMRKDAKGAGQGNPAAASDFFLSFLAKELKVKKSDILDFDLYVYNPEPPCLVGMNEEFISSPRLDNQTSCFALLRAMIEGTHKSGIDAIALFDNEEIGSTSKQGADSTLLSRLLEKLYASLGLSSTKLCDDVTAGFLLSVDVAHAVHPNRADKFDPANCAKTGDGVILKMSINQRYSYDTEAVASIRQLLEANSIPYKKFVNHSDMAGGGTIGPIISSILPMKTVDTGVPILAMHSCREMMGAADQYALERMVTKFFD